MELPPGIKNTLTRIRKSHIAIAVLVAIVLIVWLASGERMRAQNDAPEPATAEPADADAPAPKVEVRRVSAQEYAPEQVAQGQLLPLRQVEVRSQTSAHISERLVELGDSVDAGEVLFALNQEDREVQLAQAQAELSLAEAELRAGERLLERDMMSQTDFLRLQAAVALAQAAREQALLQQEYTQIRAPFAGIIDRLPVEEGDYIQQGEGIATLVDLTALELSAYVPQQQVQPLQAGQPVVVTLLDGTRLSGELTYVASSADTSTRSFRVEALIANPAGRRVAGASATLAIQLPQQAAHRLSPSLLVLDSQGRLGIKVVTPDDLVEFLPINILGFDAEGVWVEGLPSQVDLITLGGGFVQEGQAVQSVRAEGA